jgi:hypothetical protein
MGNLLGFVGQGCILKQVARPSLNTINLKKTIKLALWGVISN